MDSSSRVVFGAAMLWAAIVVNCVVATDYTVGDGGGWAMGVDYSTWTTDKTFLVGDNLVFNYAGGAHTVDEVSKSDYTACSNANSVSTDSSGATTIPLKTAGDHYFICAAAGHCSNGMKLSVSVKAASPTTSSTPPSSTTTTTSPPSTTTTTTTSPPSTRTTSEPSAAAAVVSPVGALLGSLVIVFVSLNLI